MNLDPELLKMKQEMRSLQKKLSELRTRFDDYIKCNGINACSFELESSSSKRNCPEESKTSGATKKLKIEEKEKVENGFTVENDGFLVVYTDGSALYNGRNGAQAGIGVYFAENHPM